MREHAATNESLKLALHEQGGAALVLTSIELPEEGLEVPADDAVEDPLPGRATHVQPRLHQKFVSSEVCGYFWYRPLYVVRAFRRRGHAC